MNRLVQVGADGLEVGPRQTIQHVHATGLGFATALVGLIGVMPWLGHASFHAYKELVEP